MRGQLVERRRLSEAVLGLSSNKSRYRYAFQPTLGPARRSDGETPFEEVGMPGPVLGRRTGAGGLDPALGDRQRAEACLGIDVADVAEVAVARAPAMGPAGRAGGAHPGVGAAGDQPRAARQAVMGQGLGDAELVGLGRRDEQGFTDRGVFVVGQVTGQRQAAEAVGHGQPFATAVRRGGHLQRALDAFGPALQLRAAGIALGDAPGLAVLALQPGLPVGRAAVVQARDDQDTWRLVGHGSRLRASRSTLRWT
mmetsp:Transcript_1012/g.2502  ORF Transcript_1012/g.2502 Transcript_1012/m.2502 type:complete len:253 (-) Transcript_1012:1637-2395(-)